MLALKMSREMNKKSHYSHSAKNRKFGKNTVSHILHVTAPNHQRMAVDDAITGSLLKSCSNQICNFHMFLFSSWYDNDNSVPRCCLFGKTKNAQSHLPWLRANIYISVIPPKFSLPCGITALCSADVVDWSSMITGTSDTGSSLYCSQAGSARIRRELAPTALSLKTCSCLLFCSTHLKTFYIIREKSQDISLTSLQFSPHSRRIFHIFFHMGMISSR